MYCIDGIRFFGMLPEKLVIAEGGHPHDITERNMASITQQIKRMILLLIGVDW